MKKEDLFEAVNDIDDEYIEEKLRKKPWVKWAGIAACLCLVIIGAFAILKPYETGGGYDAGGADMDGMAVMYSIAVYPKGESEENVESAEIMLLSETEAYSFETLGEHLPTALPAGYSYQSGSLYETTMKDGTKYHMMRVTYADGPAPEEIVTEDGGVMLPEGAEFPNEVVVMVTDFEPDTDKEIYTWGEFIEAYPESLDLNIVWGYSVYGDDGEVIYKSVDSMDLPADDILVIVKSMD